MRYEIKIMKTINDYREIEIKALHANFAHIKTHKHEQRIDKYSATAKKDILRYWLDMPVISNFSYVRVNEIRRSKTIP